MTEARAQLGYSWFDFWGARVGGRETVRQEFEHTVFRSLLLKKEKKKISPRFRKGSFFG